MSKTSILEIKNLVTSFDTENGRIRAVDDVSFNVKKGATLGIVGESGCGKSVTAFSIMRLLPQPSGVIEQGKILFDDMDIVRLPADKMHEIRGNRISIIFQEPMTALNPVYRIGKQLGEVFTLHFPEMTDAEIHSESVNLLHKVGMPEPDKRLTEYPHQISGGMRQRVMISMALACKPDILIADEPTTALDVTIQAQVLELITRLQRETGMSVIFITHDLGVIAEMCDDVVVMYAGKIAEKAPVEELFKNPGHPYTRGLLSSIPRLENPGKIKLSIIKGMVPSLYELPDGCRFQNRCPDAEDICKTRIPEMKKVGDNHFAACHFPGKVPSPSFKPLQANDRKVDPPVNKTRESENFLTVSHLKMHFPIYGGIFRRKVGNVYAVDDVSLTIKSSETVGLVGESGCGKTTLGRTIVRLYKPTDGNIYFGRKNITRLRQKELRDYRRNMQMIFQDPFESLNSRHTVGDILEEPFIIHNVGTPDERKEEVKTLLYKVGLPEHAAIRFPHEFSGGQRQRIGIARAIALKPDLIICDEPVSALDVSIQSQILNLLMDLQKEMNLSYLFIAHDLAVVKHISDRIAVMYLGKIVEFTDADTIYKKPLHPYTRALISAIPIPDPCIKGEKQVLTGDVPSPVNPPAGCSFHTRCPVAIDKCRNEQPLLLPVPGTAGTEHLVSCHLV